MTTEVVREKEVSDKILQLNDLTKNRFDKHLVRCVSYTGIKGFPFTSNKLTTTRRHT